MDRGDEGRQRGDVVVARPFAGRPGVGDVDQRPQIDDDFPVLFPGIEHFFFDLRHDLLHHCLPVRRVFHEGLFHRCAAFGLKKLASSATLPMLQTGSFSSWMEMS